MQPSFGTLDFCILDKNNVHELLISSISEGKTKNPNPCENGWAYFFFKDFSVKKIQKSAVQRTIEEFMATGWVWEVLSWHVCSYNLQKKSSLILQWWDFFEGIGTNLSEIVLQVGHTFFFNNTHCSSRWSKICYLESKWVIFKYRLQYILYWFWRQQHFSDS